MFTDILTVLRAPVSTDRYRNEVRDWSAATRTPIDGLNVQPSGQSENRSTGERDTVISGWRVYGGEGMDADVLATDRVELADGTVCEVVGEVARWLDPHTGEVHHVEFALRKVSG